MTGPELRRALSSFHGTESYYSHPSRRILFTDGVKFLADQAKAYWLIDVVASWQHRMIVDRALREFQLWELVVNVDGTAVAICSRDSEDEAFRQRIPVTDFPLDYLRLYVEAGVLMLPSEH
ncbi:MAG: DUF6876 family protein [Acidobacteriota bacterium]